MNEIRTDRLVLRRAVAADLPAVHAFMSSPSAMRYWSTPPHESMAVTAPWFQAQFFSGDPGRDEWIIELDGRAVGNIGIWNMPEFGFILHPDVWGRGVATEAARAFVDHAFGAHPIDGITADVDPRNLASLRLLGRLGFAETGRAERTFHVAGEWCDSVYLKLSRPA
ncbi:GNAT family N-acetyltransferase [Devosia sp.]|uniref:GNAT family N-acetyltransferase n=1 Tax=Devosia sp. TaxID=1871048 RepID=UPI0035B22DBE